jgi:hypothetical protein
LVNRCLFRAYSELAQFWDGSWGNNILYRRNERIQEILLALNYSRSDLDDEKEDDGDVQKVGSEKRLWRSVVGRPLRLPNST